MDTDEVLSAVPSDDLRDAERRTLAGRPDGMLMDRAAARLASICAQRLQSRFGGVYGRRVVLLVGTGNNGGDALLAGGHLRARGAQVSALLIGDVAHERGVRAFLSAGGQVHRIADGIDPRATAALAAAELVLDGIAGISGKPGLRGVAEAIVEAIPRAAVVLALDLPSGVDPENGETPDSHVVAHATVAFGALHPCLLLPPAAHAAGEVIFADVGVTGALRSEPVVQRLTSVGVGRRWPVPKRSDHKYTRGVLGIVAGSDTYPGAAVLAVAGAVRAGVGVARYVGPARVTDQVLRARPEAVPGVGRVQAWLLGSGVEDDATQDEAIETALTSGLPCVVDAGALDACVQKRAAGAMPAPASSILLTPHAGELVRALGVLGHTVSRPEVEARPYHHVRWLAREIEATVLLKGSTTLIAAPDGPVYSQADGPAWMATAGSGDVLAGIAGMLLAAGLDACEAGAMAALVHGQAGARACGGGPLAAIDIADAIPAVVAGLLK